MFTAEPHHIIAIGASAGGMDEINSFFDHTPLDGVSYIIIQHLSSDFKSRMVELLARHSKLVVKEAENGMTVVCNEVYLIPHDKFMTINDGTLYLTEKNQVKGPHLTINTFFNSLAADCGKKSIGIILSGLGSDGTEGVKSIKKAGGMVIARNPSTSEFGSMPSSAISTGLVDFVLEPALMPGAIEDYVKNAGELLTDHEDDEKNLKLIIELIKESLPLDFTDYKQTTILRRTKRRASYGNFTSLTNYLNFLRVTPEEVVALSKEFLISVTSFFRDKGAFEFIQKEVMPEILKKLTPGDELKMWVAGCATGEEVYSLAILIAELLKGEYEDTVVKIFATDIDGAALIHAGKGIYAANITKDVTPARLEKYFIKEGENFRVSPVIRKMVIFAQHDLVKNPPYCNMHFISCRNLLIYMTSVLQKRIFSMLLFGLKMDGYLFLGSSENPMPILKNLEVVQKKWKIYKNLESKRGISFDAFSLPDLLDIKRTPSRFAIEDIAKSVNPVLSETMHLALASDLDYLAICVDEDNQVVNSYGDTTKYLLQKHFTSNLTELLAKPLAIAFNTLRTSALKLNGKAEVKGIKIKQQKEVFKVNLSVSPLEIKGDAKLLMVIFTEFQATGQKEDLVYDETIYLDQYTQNLEAELKELKDKLHSSYERLDASNENMQSFNEELISANEEMQSTNEEMQSVNEELHTINADYQLKNKELLDINDDLNNYFRSNINGQLFINNDLELMRFSPGTVKQINLLETDIGRPLSNISTNIKFETIVDDIKQVLSDGFVITKEIETNNGKWYQIMTMPYVQQATNKNNGAIITFNDITELKHTQLEIDKKNKTLQRINSDLDHFIHAASHDLLAPLGNIETSINIMNKITLSDVKLMEFLKIINTSIKKFRELITDIATIAKVESDMIATEMVDIEEIMNNIEWSLENKIVDSKAVITRNLEVKQILFSKKNLRSIVYNLISNAIKFRREEAPAITIHTWSESDHIVLSVRDNGKGIPKGGIDKIFNMYGRLNQDVEGHGIGLYLAKKIVNAAGGNIIVESEPGIGSTFMIYLKVETEDLVLLPFLN
ncbi:MAG: chemotaxis protein CheB [Mucilaginibacter sp.]|uniref:chemotaxis protein CheB n=1 Tax=Mucilaginibacter sp. TaxID=1882438 RepID=UPI0032652A2B